MTALVIAEHDNKSIKGATLNTVTAAAAAGGEVHVLVAGHNASGAAQAASKIAGVTKVLHAEAPGFEHGLAENLAAQVIAIAGSYSHLVFPATAAGKNVAPRVAALLDVAQVSDVTKVISADTFERPIYAGNAIATVQSLDKVKVLTVRTTGFDPAAATGASAAVETISAIADNGSSVFVGSEIAKNDRPELTAAKIIVSGGRALGSSDKFTEVLTPLADKLGAALGASRAAVDAGYAPNDWQVGQTGKIVAPQLYIAAGISGAIQHLAGMKDSKVIVAINKDPEAPIFSVADYGLEADLFTAVPEPHFIWRHQMTYRAPVKDMLFCMQELAGWDQVAKLPGFDDAGIETAQAVLEESAKLNEQVIAPLNVEGDRQPSYWKDGKVFTTPGFKDAFKQFGEGGWQGLQHPTDFGGQGLPKTIGAACIEMINSANLSFALCPLLTDGAIEALLTAGTPEQQSLFLPKMMALTLRSFARAPSRCPTAPTRSSARRSSSPTANTTWPRTSSTLCWRA